MPRRVLAWPACLNVRDLGGLATRFGAPTRYASLVRADDLARLTPDGARALVAYDARTVVDLRDQRELAHAPSPFAHDAAVVYVNAPLLSDADWAAAAARPLPPHEADVRTLELSARDIGAALRSIAAAAPGAVVFHCSAGMERTGIVALLVLALAGVADEAIASDYVASVPLMRPLFERRVATLDQERRAGTARWLERIGDPAHVHATLRHLREHGGVERYLASVGLAESEISALRARLV